MISKFITGEKRDRKLTYSERARERARARESKINMGGRKKEG